MEPTCLNAYIVEDNPTIRENLVGTLEELTAVRVVATSGTEADTLRWIQAHPNGWDLLIVDLFLQQGTGLHLVQKLAGRKPAQKVVIFSNYVNSNVRKRCAQLGVDAVFDKSTEIDALVDYCARQCWLKSSAGAEPRDGPAP